MFFYIIILFFILITLSEKNRRRNPPTDKYKYYNNKTLVFAGLINSLINIFNNSYIFDISNVKVHNEIKNNHEKLLEEFNSAYKKDKLINPGIFDKKFKQKNENYGYFYINYYGYIENKSFPVLTSILKKYPSMQSAFYSIIKGPKKIHKHKGPYSGILRYHYTLFSCNTKKDYLKVKDKKLYWFEKDAFIFDDTYEHFLKKRSNGLRVSLILDIKRDLPKPLGILNKLFLRYVKDTNYVKKKRIKIKQFSHN
uniref:Aspartyl/asparaginy/proline hydroxylase domain-containing protein n=1 Tax=viral metagenome TaxID=1070528 RepID=A0A6C0LZV0_9ZZZZ